MSFAFEWDTAKAVSNEAKHAVSFETAQWAFYDPFAVEWLDDRFDEERYGLLGMVQGRLLFIAYTWRDDTIRLISARGAVLSEEKRYFDENAW